MNKLYEARRNKSTYHLTEFEGMSVRIEVWNCMLFLLFYNIILIFWDVENSGRGWFCGKTTTCDMIKLWCRTDNGKTTMIPIIVKISLIDLSDQIDEQKNYFSNKITDLPIICRGPWADTKPYIREEEVLCNFRSWKYCK